MSASIMPSGTDINADWNNSDSLDSLFADADLNIPDITPCFFQPFLGFPFLDFNQCNNSLPPEVHCDLLADEQLLTIKQEEPFELRPTIKQEKFSPFLLPSFPSTSDMDAMSIETTMEEEVKIKEEFRKYNELPRIPRVRQAALPPIIPDQMKLSGFCTAKHNKKKYRIQPEVASAAAELMDALLPARTNIPSTIQHSSRRNIRKDLTASIPVKRKKTKKEPFRKIDNDLLPGKKTKTENTLASVLCPLQADIHGKADAEKFTLCCEPHL